MPSWPTSNEWVERWARESMQAEIRITGPASGAELADLGRWLSAQRGLVGRVSQVQGEIGEQELGGGAVELLSVALGSGGVVSVLSSAVSAWLGNRQRTIKITVDGVSAEFPAGTRAEVLARYLEALKGQGSSA